MECLGEMVKGSLTSRKLFWGMKSRRSYSHSPIKRGLKFVKMYVWMLINTYAYNSLYPLLNPGQTKPALKTKQVKSKAKVLTMAHKACRSTPFMVLPWPPFPSLSFGPFSLHSHWPPYYFWNILESLPLLFHLLVCSFPGYLSVTLQVYAPTSASLWDWLDLHI